MTTYSLIQIILAVAATYQVVRAVHALVRGRRGFVTETLFQLGSWGVVLVFALFPQSAQTLSEFLGMGENLNTLIFTGFVILFWINMYTLHHVRKQQRDITSVVRETVLRDVKKDS